MSGRQTKWKLALLIAAVSFTWTACASQGEPGTSSLADASQVTPDGSADWIASDQATVDAFEAGAQDSSSVPEFEDAEPNEEDLITSDGTSESDITDSASVDAAIEASGGQDADEPSDLDGAEPPPGPITVLFIGNSYTFGNQLPDLVEQWAQSINVDLSTEMIAKGGALLENHAADPQTLNTIAEMAPTYVVLQGQSYVPLVAPFTFYTGVAPLAQAAHAAGSTPVLFETWARQAGHSMYSNELAGHDPTTMQAALREAYKKAASDNDGLYAPVGDAWEVSLGANPDLVLHSGDGSHAALTGSYLAAAVFVGMLGDINLSEESNAWIPEGVEPSDGALLRDAAQQVLSAP